MSFWFIVANCFLLKIDRDPKKEKPKKKKEEKEKKKNRKRFNEDDGNCVDYLYCGSHLSKQIGFPLLQLLFLLLCPSVLLLMKMIKEEL